jgi:hypothetical protein
MRRTPAERELDGLPLDTLTPGSVHDVSAVIATWLVAQGYAELEMRHVDDDVFSSSDAEDRQRSGH